MTAGNRIRRKKLLREAEGYLEVGMPKHALRALARLGDPTDLDPHALFLWGESLREMQRYEEALVPLRQAAEAAPGSVPVRLALGWCYKRTGRIDRAIESLEQALALGPHDPLLHYNLACYWSLARNKRHALEYLAQALALDPDYRRLIADEPDFDPLRADPDFQALEEGLGITE